MYKTIRHGENSLQYTILPQHDDYKGIDGKSRSHRSGRKKRNLMAFIGLFFVCSIITGAILVPLMVSVEFMASPTAWFQHRPIQIGNNATKQATLALIKNERIKSSSKFSRINNSTVVDGRLTQSTIVTYPTTDSPPSTQTTTSATSTTTIASTTTVFVTSTPSSTTTIEPIVTKTSANLNFENPEPETTNMPDATTAIGSGKNGQRTGKVSFDSAKSVNQIKNMNKTESAQAPKNWLKSHWPIVDPSTYFQWTDYESEDNVLLPAIFCLAIVGLIIFASLCIVIKNKKCCSRKRKEFLSVEAQNGDNTTLLTNECPSDDE